MVDDSGFRDVRLPFRFVRPRALLCLGVILAGYLLLLALDPATVQAGHPVGPIDLVLRGLPEPVQTAALCFASLFLLSATVATYWPCVRDDALVIFDGRRLHGFDLWGRKASLLRSEVTGVAFRYGAASVATGSGRIWIPLSLLDLDRESSDNLKSFLRAMGR